MKLSICFLLTAALSMALLLSESAEAKSFTLRSRRNAEPQGPEPGQYPPPSPEGDNAVGPNGEPLQEGRHIIPAVADFLTGIVSGVFGTNRAPGVQGGISWGGATYNNGII